MIRSQYKTLFYNVYNKKWWMRRANSQSTPNENTLTSILPGKPPIYRRVTEKTQEEILLGPFNYITKKSGKKIRTKFSYALNHWLNVPLDKRERVDEIIEILHNAGLLLDDIQDNSLLRRGVPVAHSVYGVSYTINSANYAIFIALEKTLELNQPGAVKIYKDQLLELHRGQGMELYWRDYLICPTEDEYKQMAVRKTSSLFILNAMLLQLFSKNKIDCTKLSSLLGLYFQIRDDYINLNSKEYTDKKGYCEDISEGKFSFPIVHAVASQSDDQIINILKQKTSDVEVKKYFIFLLEKYGSFDYTRMVLESLETEISVEIERLGGNPNLTELLIDLKRIS